MTTKQAIIASLIVVAIIIVLGLLTAFLFIDITAPGAEERVGKLGGAFGTLSVIPFAVIWWKWGMTIRQQREAATRPKSKKRARSN